MSVRDNHHHVVNLLTAPTPMEALNAHVTLAVLEMEETVPYMVS